jgi:AcrR family transcriptional regulator
VTEHWLVGNQAAVAADRILDAAGNCFVRQGVAHTSIGDIAREAGCSRPTVYRYFSDRDALRQSFMHREARQLGQTVANAIRDIEDPGQRLVEAILHSLQGVRSNPLLSAWFTSEDGVATMQLASASPLLTSLTASLLPTVESESSAQANWVVRMILSFLLLPGKNKREEREMIERFVVPVVVTSHLTDAASST